MHIRLVLHAPTPAALNRARSNARNLLKDMPDAEVEIVANAEAATAALTATDPETDALILICANSLKRHNATAGPDQKTTPAAVTHIATRQQQGWQYLRA